MKRVFGQLWRVACLPLLIFAIGPVDAAQITHLRGDEEALARSAALPARADLPALATALGLGSGDELNAVSVAADADGGSVTRYRQSFRGVPVWGQQLIVERDASGRISGLNGQVVRGIAADVPQVQPRLAERTVLNSMRVRLAQRFGNVAPVVTREQIELVLFTGRDEAPIAQAQLAFAVELLADSPGGGSPTRPITLVDALTGQVLFEVDSLAHQTLDCSSGCTLLQQTGLAGSRGTWLYRTLTTLPTLSAGSTLEVNISGGSGDADLYVRKGSNPTSSAYACRPFVAGNNETCTLSVATGEAWYVGIYGYRSYSNVTLTARIVAPLAPATSAGPGGNVKTTQYRYGSATDDDYQALVVRANATTCSMTNPNVRTVHLRNGTSGSTAYEYSVAPSSAGDTCFNDADAVNGAYSPLNDAHYFGGVVYDMYGAWLDAAPLTFPLTMRVHYSTNYENAFWDGAAMTFGDGATQFYPFVGLDVTAHEVSHGFTEQNSNLVYSGQSGGMNEAYSDIAGEAAEYFMRGSNDFLVGGDIVKGSGALRYMCTPTLDGRSIDNVANYTSGLDVHYSSGIYNKAFCQLAQSSGWNTRWAFEAFARANQRCWTSSSTFSSGAQCVVDQVEKINTARGMSLDVNAAVDAFAAVGITGILLPGQTPTITLTAKGTVRSGRQQVLLSWTGSTAASIDIYRDSAKVATASNTGSYTDKPSGKTSYVYKVCNAGTTNCSPNVTVQF